MLTAEDRARASEERARAAEERACAAEERARAAEERTHAAEKSAATTDERLRTTEERLQSAEQRIDGLSSAHADSSAARESERQAEASRHSQALEELRNTHRQQLASHAQESTVGCWQLHAARGEREGFKSLHDESARTYSWVDPYMHSFLFFSGCGSPCACWKTAPHSWHRKTLVSACLRCTRPPPQLYPSFLPLLSRVHSRTWSRCRKSIYPSCHITTHPSSLVWHTLSSFVMLQTVHAFFPDVHTESR